MNFCCQVVSREASGQSLLAAHYRVDGHPRVNPIQVGSTEQVGQSWHKLGYLSKNLSTNPVFSIEGDFGPILNSARQKFQENPAVGPALFKFSCKNYFFPFCWLHRMSPLWSFELTLSSLAQSTVGPPPLQERISLVQGLHREILASLCI